MYVLKALNQSRQPMSLQEDVITDTLRPQSLNPKPQTETLSPSKP